MADKPVHEVEGVDAALDALSSPTSSDVFEAVDLFSSKAVAAVAAKRALSGGGGSSAVLLADVTIDLATFLTIGYDPAAPPYYPNASSQVVVIVPGVQNKVVVPVFGWMRYVAGDGYLMQSGTKNLDSVYHQLGYSTVPATFPAAYNMPFNGFQDNISSIIGDASDPPDRFYSELFPLGPDYPETELNYESLLGQDLVFTLIDGHSISLPLSGGDGGSFSVKVAYWLF